MGHLRTLLDSQSREGWPGFRVLRSSRTQHVNRQRTRRVASVTSKPRQRRTGGQFFFCAIGGCRSWPAVSITRLLGLFGGLIPRDLGTREECVPRYSERESDNSVLWPRLPLIDRSLASIITPDASLGFFRLEWGGTTTNASFLWTQHYNEMGGGWMVTTVGSVNVGWRGPKRARARG